MKAEPTSRGLSPVNVEEQKDNGFGGLADQEGVVWRPGLCRRGILGEPAKG